MEMVPVFTEHFTGLFLVLNQNNEFPNPKVSISHLLLLLLGFGFPNPKIGPRCFRVWFPNPKFGQRSFRVWENLGKGLFGFPNPKRFGQ
jgi:hypothetical protein